jgi:hypothetical protein
MKHADDVDDPVVSPLTIFAVVSFVIGGIVDKYVFDHDPPVMLLFGLFCLFLLFDALNGLKNRSKRLEGKLNAILEKLDKR